MVLGRKTDFFLGKAKKTSFWTWKKLVFPSQNHLFPRKKLVFHAKTIFSLGKSWFFCPKPSFS